MSTIEVARAADGQVEMEIGQTLSGRRFALNLGNEVSSPARAISLGLSGVRTTMNRFLDGLELIDADPSSDNLRVADVEEAWKQVMYSATELFESYEDNLTKCFPYLLNGQGREQSKEYKKLVKRHRERWSMPTNKIKHNHNIIVNVTHFYFASLRHLNSFTLLKPEGLTERRVNKDLHKGQERCRSYNIALRQLVFDILKVDALAAKLVAGIPDEDGAEQLPALPMRWRAIDTMERIAKRPKWMTLEEPIHFDNFVVQEELITTFRDMGDRIAENAKVTYRFQGDGITNIIPMI